MRLFYMSRKSRILFVLVITAAGLVIAWYSSLAAPDDKPPHEPNLITFSKIDKAWAHSRGENVKVAVTNSMGPLTQGRELQEAIDYAEQKGTIFIDVHPETRTSTLDQRIIHSGVVAVLRYRTRPESGRDTYVRPYEINPVFKDGWGFSNGPPIVAGVIALMKGANPKLTPVQTRRILMETADEKAGFRVLNAEAATRKAVELRD